MTFENFERMEGLSSISATEQMTKAMRKIAEELLFEGFDDNEVKEYFALVAGFVVDDATDPL
jgi:hypothetical protein